VLAWDALKIVEQYAQGYIEGSIEYRSYEDRESLTRFVTEDPRALGDPAGRAWRRRELRRGGAPGAGAAGSQPAAPMQPNRHRSPRNARACYLHAPGSARIRTSCEPPAVSAVDHNYTTDVPAPRVAEHSSTRPRLHMRTLSYKAALRQLNDAVDAAQHAVLAVKRRAEEDVPVPDWYDMLELVEETKWILGHLSDIRQTLEQRGQDHEAVAALLDQLSPPAPQE
jgi:single-stranded DNA-binding protein